MDPEEVRAQLKRWAIIGAFFALAFLFSVLGWRTVLTAYVMIVGVLAVLSILMQSGRGGGLAASLGGLGGDSLLGVRSATPIAKATYVMLGLFLFICMLIARLGPARGQLPGLLPAEPVGAEAPAPGMGAGPSTPLPSTPLPSTPLPSTPRQGSGQAPLGTGGTGGAEPAEPAEAPAGTGIPDVPGSGGSPQPGELP